MHFNTLQHLQQELVAGRVSCVQIVESYLENIQKNTHLNAFLEVFGTEALENAQQVDKKVQNKKQGKLAGLVVGLKDNISYQGHAVSASSKILDGYTAVYNATVVERVLAEAAIKLFSIISKL